MQLAITTLTLCVCVTSLLIDCHRLLNHADLNQTKLQPRPGSAFGRPLNTASMHTTADDCQSYGGSLFSCRLTSCCSEFISCPAFTLPSCHQLLPHPAAAVVACLACLYHPSFVTPAPAGAETTHKITGTHNKTEDMSQDCLAGCKHSPQDHPMIASNCTPS